jgi:glutathione peroxidase
MKTIFQRVAVIGFVIGSAAAASASPAADSAATLPPLTQKSIYDFTVKDIEGKNLALKKYKGQVLLLVNVASECGNTPQYSGLQKLFLAHKKQGFSILGFPANNFGAQEPGTDQEIRKFCTKEYQITFPLFSKISTAGPDKHPLYRFLTEKATNPEFSGEVSWNFEKFLVDKTGRIVARFEPGVKPDDPKLVETVNKYLESK